MISWFFRVLKSIVEKLVFIQFGWLSFKMDDFNFPGQIVKSHHEWYSFLFVKNRFPGTVADENSVTYTSNEHYLLYGRLSAILNEIHPHQIIFDFISIKQIVVQNSSLNLVSDNQPLRMITDHRGSKSSDINDIVAEKVILRIHLWQMNCEDKIHLRWMNWKILFQERFYSFFENRKLIVFYQKICHCWSLS
jgi:hypothetical protein